MKNLREKRQELKSIKETLFREGFKVESLTGLTNFINKISIDIRKGKQ